MVTFWPLAGLFFLMLELFIPTGTCLFLGVGAFGAGLASFAFDGIFWQCLVFAIISLCGLVFFRRRFPVFCGSHVRQPHPAVGRIGIMREKMEPGETGEAEIAGSFWRVRAENPGETFQRGECVVATGNMSGDELTLLVKKG